MKNRFVTPSSMMQIIKLHDLKPNAQGDYCITDEMIDEAEALDKALGKAPSPEMIEKMERECAAGEWEEIDEAPTTPLTLPKCKCPI
jgi:hypothetical protein